MIGKRLLALLCACTLLVNGTGCATILTGTRQDVPVSVSPTGTEVSVYRWNGDRIAGPLASPGTLEVPRPSRSESYIVLASKEGYCPHYWMTSASGTPLAMAELIGTIFFFPMMLAWATDVRTGAGYSLEPNYLHAALKPEDTCGR